MAKATVVVTADNQIKKGLDPAKKAMLEFQTTVDGIQKKISKAFSIASVATAVVASVKTITKAAKECINEYTEAEKVFKRLDAVWKNVGQTTGMTYNQVMRYADAIEKSTYFTGEAVEESALLLAATESLTEEGFKRALDASVDLAAALGEDVTSATQTLAKAIQEPESALSRLKTIGVSFTEDEKNQIKALTDANKQYEAQSLILDKIEQKYKGVAKAINDTPAGTLDNIKDTLGDIRENLGGALLNALSPALEDIYGWLTKISGWMADLVDANGIAAQLQKGSSLAGFSIIQLNAVKRLYEDQLQTNPRANGRDMTTFLKSAIEAIEKEIAERPVTTVSTPIINTSDNAIETTVSKTIKSLLSSSGGLSSLYVEQGYMDTLAEIEGYLAFLKDESISRGDKNVFLTANGMEGANVQGVINILEEVYEGIAQKLMPEEVLGIELPNAIAEAIEKHGGLSKTKEINEIKDAIRDIEDIYDSATASEQTILREVDATLREQLASLLRTEENTSKENFIEIATDWLAKLIGPSSDNEVARWHIGKVGFNVDSEQADIAANSIMNTFTSNMGEAGEAVETLAQNMAVLGPAFGAIVTAIQYVIEGLMEVIGPVFSEQVMIVVDSLMEIGRAVGQVLLPLIKIMTPILEALVKPILFITGTFTYVGQAFQSAMAGLFNWLASINIAGWRPFGGLHMDDPGMPGNYVDYMSNYFANYNSGSSASESASTSTALSSASYRGATQVTINIYQMSPVVGDNGMREFASMIREEFEALDYYGVSA